MARTSIIMTVVIAQVIANTKDRCAGAAAMGGYPGTAHMYQASARGVRITGPASLVDQRSPEPCAGVGHTGTTTVSLVWPPPDDMDGTTGAASGRARGGHC